MGFWEVALHLLALDLPWLISLITGNLFWLFTLLAAVYMIQKGKHVLWAFILVVAIILFSADLAPYYGLAIYTASGLMLLYLLRLAVLSFTEHNARLKKYFKLAWFLTFWVVIYVYNVFILGG